MRLIALSLVLITCALPHRTANAQSASARADRVEHKLLPSVRIAGRPYTPATIDERMREYGIPAVSVAVVDSGRIVWARAYGLADVESGRAATPATLFQAASISKPVASTAALQLVQEGTLALDAPVNSRLHSWRIPENKYTTGRGHEITLRQLLTHSAGLTIHGFPGYPAGAPVPTIVQVLNGGPPANTDPVVADTTPGVRYAYSGGGITVMQLLLQDVTGQDFPRLMQERVLGPAEMNASTYEQPLPASRASEAATGYRVGGKPVEGRYHAYPEMAAAGLWTNPTDLARWILAIQRSLAGEPHSLLSTAMARAMVTRGVGGWGLGVGLEVLGEHKTDEALTFNHGGANEGFRCQLVGFVGSRRGAVVMTNSDAGGRLAEEIIRAIGREYEWPGSAPHVITPVPMTAEALRAYEGTYATSKDLRVRVMVDGSALWLTLPWGEKRELVPTGGDLVESPQGGDARFVRNADGRVTAIVLHGGDRLERIAQ